MLLPKRVYMLDFSIVTIFCHDYTMVIGCSVVFFSRGGAHNEGSFPGCYIT